MGACLAISLTESGPKTNLIQLRQDFAAGLMVGFLALPICIAAGVLTASPLGTETVAEGAMAGLYGGLVAGFVAALISNSSFIVTCPRASPALVLATLIGSLVAAPQIAANPSLALLAAAACVFLAGIWQIVFCLPEDFYTDQVHATRCLRRIYEWSSSCHYKLSNVSADRKS